MPRTPNASVLQHSFFHLVHMKSISPHSNVCPPHQIPQESPHTPHHITQLVLEVSPAPHLDQFNHLIPQVQDPLPQVKLLVTHTTTELRVHLSHQKYQTRIFKKVFQFFLHLLKFFSNLIFYDIKKKLKCFFTNFGIVNHSSGTSLLKQNVVR